MQLNQFLIIFLIGILSSPPLSGQNVTKKETKSYIIPHDWQVVEILEDEANGKMYRLLVKEEGLALLDKKVGCSQYYAKRQFSLLVETGTIHKFRMLERVHHIYQDTLFTVERNALEGKSIIRRYALKNENLTKLKNELILDHPEQPIIHLKNKNHNFILSDHSLELGTFAMIYSKDLKPTLKYQPSNSGYRSVIYGTQGNEFIAITNPRSTYDSVKIFIQNLKNRKVILYKNLDIYHGEFLAKSIYAFQDMFLVYGDFNHNDRKVIALDYHGNVLWSQPYVLPLFHMGLGIKENPYDKTLVAQIKSESISCLNSYTGEIIWRKNFNKLYSEDKAILPDNEWMNGGLFFGEFQPLPGGETGVIVGQIIEKEPPYYKLSKSRFYLFSARGDIIDEFPIPGDSHVYKMRQTKDGFEIHSDQNMIRYEIR